MIDAVLSTFLKPLIGISDVIRIFLAVVVCILPIIFRFITKGKRGFTKLDEVHTFLSSLPGGRFLFNRLVLWLSATYTETIRPTVTKVSSTEATVHIDALPWMSNPFRSIHAAALLNLAECTSAMAVLCATQHRKGARAIPNRIDIQYLKKAKGRITASTKIQLPSESGPYPVSVELRDAKGVVVCTAVVSWQVQVKDS